MNMEIPDMSDFVHLHVHTQYSLLDGAARIPELVSTAKKLGQTAMAITDHGVMYGVIDFYRACKKEGLKPIIGMEEPWRYRNKAVYPIGRDRDGSLIAGFYAGRTHSIISCSDCMLGPEENREILQCILDHMERHRISP